MTTKSIASIALLFAFFCVNAQQNFCSILVNGKFQSTDYSTSTPFSSGLVSNWTASHGEPWLNAMNPLSDTASPEIEAEVTSFLTDVGSGIKTSSKISFKKGRKYYIVFNYKNNGNILAPSLNVALVSDNKWGTKGNTLPIAGLNGFSIISNTVVPASQTTWAKQVVCFTAPFSSADLWFYLLGTRNGICKVGIDNVEIYEDFDFAGSPKIRYTCDSVVSIGLNPSGPCTPINSLPTHKWYTTKSATVLGTTQSIVVFPTVTTSYVVERNNGGCITYDTITVVPVSKPIFYLATDTTVCQCETLSLYPNMIDLDGCATYKWDDGSTTIPRIINHNNPLGYSLTETFTLTVTNKCTGCSTTKSINVTYKPVPNCAPRTKYMCDKEFPQSIDTKGIGTYYSWSWKAPIPPSLPTTSRSLQINSVGTYICTVTDTNGRCTIGRDTVVVWPWDSIRLKIAVMDYNPCYRDPVTMYNRFDSGMVMNWYKDGVFKATTSHFATSENGVFVAEFASPLNRCWRRDTVEIKFIDPPQVNWPTFYGSFCKNECDTLLTFDYCDTCGEFMGRVTDISWSGPGVVSRTDSKGKLNYYFCAYKAKCGNNGLAAKITYTKYGIVCSRYYYCSAFKVCPLELDSVAPICSSDDDIYLLSLGNMVYNASIHGDGVYTENGTGAFKFSPKQAGSGLHTIRYFYSDNAGCSGWDSISILVLNAPKLKLQLVSDWWCDLKLKVTGTNSDPYYTGSYTITSNLIGDFTLAGGAVRNPIVNQTIAIQPNILYWVKICNESGCCAYETFEYKMEDHFKMEFDSTQCLTKGLQICFYNEGKPVTAYSHPSTLAYRWDNDPIAYISTNIIGADPNFQWLDQYLKTSANFYGLQKIASPSACHSVFTAGWHKITILAIGGCEYTDSVLIPFDCKTCPEEEIQDIFITQPLEIWNNQYRIINGNIYIMPGASLQIDNSMIYFKPCSKIVVENSAGAGNGFGGDAASLSIVNNSVLMGCPNWKGIEVWGVADVYDWNGINIELGKDPRTELNGAQVIASPGLPNVTNNWPYVYVKNSVIQDADIAIFSGKIDDGDQGTFDPHFTGGLVFVDGSTFNNNYTDIVFTPRPGVLMNAWPATQSWNASYIVRSTFNQRKATNDCSDMYWYAINGTNTPNNRKITNVSTACHIADLTETQDFSLPNTYDYYNGPGFYNITFGLSIQHISTLKRDARIPYNIWHGMHEFDTDRNPYNNITNPLSDKVLLGNFKNSLISNCNNW